MVEDNLDKGSKPWPVGLHTAAQPLRYTHICTLKLGVTEWEYTDLKINLNL